ncbi:unnamed protein product [Orchesella dallaii]|uniref:GH16 domain-containing protein n=1 Tax=Orchesella dallaii TaxID=48710 RepID=A0ABP1RGS2_9HEXA
MGKLSILALIAICTVSLARADWELVWEDQFDGNDLFVNWKFDQGCNGWGNNELECYTVNRPENVRQENGILVITARREWWDDGQTTLPFTSTRMLTHSNFLYGKFEIRARLPKGKHLWPAFWMMPTFSEYGEWPRSGEIDIMEYRGQRPTNTLGTIHYGESKENKGQSGSPETTFPYDFSQDFHVFGLDWSPTKMMWIVDDRVYHEETLERNFWESVYTANGQPYDKEFHIIINLAVGGMFFGDEPFDPIEADGWEKPTYEIDWIRKWTWRM